MQNSNININNELLKSAAERLWEAIRLSAESILELKTKVKNIEDQNTELYSSFIKSDEESSSLKIENAEFEKKNIEQDELLNKLNDDIKELTLRLDSAAIFEHKYSEINRKYEELQLKYNSTEKHSKNELLEKIKELEDSHTNYGFLQKEITRRNFDLHQRDETILKQKETIASLDSRIFILKDIEKKYDTAKDKLESLEQTFDDLTNQRDKLMEKFQEAKSMNESNSNSTEGKLNKYKEELESQAEAIELYTNKLNNFNIERATWNTTKDEYLKTIDTLYDDITLFKEEITNSNQIIEDLKAQNDTIYTKDVIINEQNLKLKQLSAVITANESTLEQFNNKIRESEHKYNNSKQEETLIKDKFEELNVEYNKDKERILSYEKSLTELQIDVNEKGDKLFKFEKDFEELIESNCNQETEINDLKSKINTLNNSNEELIHTLENENHNLKLKIESLNNSYSEFIKNLETENFDLKSKLINSSQSETVFLQALENENNELKSKVENSVHSNLEFLKAIESDNIEMKIRITENNLLIETLQIENNSLKRIIESLKESNQLNEIDLKVVKEKSNELERQLNTFKEIVSSKDGLFSETKSLNELYQLKNQQLTTSLMEKDNRIDELNMQLAKNNNSLSSEDLNKMQSDINSLNNVIKERDFIINDLNQKRYELEGLIKKRYEHIDILEKDLENEVSSKSLDKEERFRITNQIKEYMSIIEKYLD